MIAKIEQLLKEVEALHASNAEELEALRIKYLSKKGAINDLMADFRNVPAEQKKEVYLSYSMLFSGKRYALGQNIAKNRLDGYTDHSVSVRRGFRWKKTNLSLALEMLNLADKNYEIVKNFPMPGRSFRITVGVKY